MAITTPDDLVAAIANNGRPVFAMFRAIANQNLGGFTDPWLYYDLPVYTSSADTPGTTAAYLTKATKGALSNFTNPTSPDKLYLASSLVTNPQVSNNTIFLVDRLAHVGGLNATTVTAQTVGIDLRISSGNVSAARIGATDYSDIIWAMEIHTDIGTTARNLTINYRNAAGTDGQTQTFTNFIGGASPANRAARLFPLDNITGGCSQINSCTLSASTGTAGNFGFVAYRIIAILPPAIFGRVSDWATLGLPEIANDTCLAQIMLCNSTAPGRAVTSLNLVTG
jgi:hypothetical protein